MSKGKIILSSSYFDIEANNSINYPGSSNLYSSFILKITQEIIKSRKFTNSNINEIFENALKNPESLNDNRLKEEAQNLKIRLRVKPKPTETPPIKNCYSISDPTNCNQTKKKISIRKIKYPPTRKYKIKNRMILTIKEIEENLISCDIPKEMSNEIALLLLDNNPKNLYDLKTAKCVSKITHPGDQIQNAKDLVDASTSYSDVTAITEWNLEAENGSEKDR